MAFREVTDIQLDGQPQEQTVNQPSRPKFREVTDIQLDGQPQEQTQQELPKMGIFNIPQNREEQLAARKNFSDIGNTFVDNMRKRGAKLFDIALAGSKEEQTNIETVGQAFANSVVGTGLDILGQAGGEVLEGAFRTLPKEAQQGISESGEAVLNTRAGQLGLRALEKGGDIWENFKQDNPRAARNIEAIALGVGGSLSVGGKSLIGTTKDVAVRGGQAAKNVATDITKKIPEIKAGREILTSEDLKALSSDVYKKATESGEIFPIEVREDLVSALQKNIPGEETLRKGSNDVQTALELMTARRDKPLTLEGAQQIDEELSQLISKNYKDGLNADGKKLLDIQDGFRTSIENSEGGALLQEGRALWSASKKMEDIERIIKNAEFTDNPATSIKNGFRTLARNKKRMRGYTAKERKLIEKAAKSGVVSNTLRTVVGSRLLSAGFGFALGGTAGGLASVGVSGAARKAAEATGKRAAGNLQREVSKRGTASKQPREIKENVEKSTVVEPVKRLTAPEEVTVVDRQGRARPMTSRERQNAESSRKRAIDTGLTPDVRRAQLRNEVEKAYQQRGKQRNAIIESQIAKIAQESSATVEQLVDLSAKNIKKLAEVIGEDGGETTFAQAFRKAIKESKKTKQLKEAIKNTEVE